VLMWIASCAYVCKCGTKVEREEYLAEIAASICYSTSSATM